MQNFPHQNLEQAFTRAISSGDDQEVSPVDEPEESPE